MAFSFIDLPKYQTSPLLDLSPINNALGFAAQQNQMAQKNAREDQQLSMQQERLGMEKQQFNEDMQKRMREQMGAKATAILDIKDPAQQRAAYDQYFLKNPKFASAAQENGIDLNDHLATLKIVQREALGARDPLDVEKTKAGIAAQYANAYQARQHGNFYARVLDMKYPSGGQPDGLQEDIGQNEDGSLVRLGRARPQSAPMPSAPQTPLMGLAPKTTPPANDARPVIMDQYLGAKNDATGETVQRESPAFGQYGVAPSSVPGIVVTPKGATDQQATRALAGQRAINAEPDDAKRQRLIDNMAQQQRYTQMYGKAPSGMAWGPNGKLVSMKDSDTQTERSARVIAEQGMRNIDRAIEAFVGGETKDEFGVETGETPKKLSGWQEIVGDKWPVPVVGGTIGAFGEGGKAYRSAERAVLDLNFALSGKGVSNREREDFKSLYMPTAMDSTDTKRDKLYAVKEFFQVVLSARQKGADDDVIAGMYRKAIDDGEKRFGGQPPSSQPSAPTALAGTSRPAPPAAAGGWVDIGNGVRVREKR